MIIAIQIYVPFMQRLYIKAGGGRDGFLWNRTVDGILAYAFKTRSLILSLKKVTCNTLKHENTV